MNLIIDQGNSSVKMGLFDSDGTCVHSAVLPVLNTHVLEELFLKFAPIAGILSSVKHTDENVQDFLCRKLTRFVPFNATTSIPIQNSYESPETLGLDRLAAAVGARTLKPGLPLLVVDMGTAITYDFITSDGVYTGGNIAPGLRMRLRAMNEFTDRLPMVEPDLSFPFLGTSTETAIRAGAMQGIVLETDGYIDTLKLKYSDLFTFLTGGDSIFFADKLKNGIFVHENLVLTGLNRILCFNESI